MPIDPALVDPPAAAHVRAATKAAGSSFYWAMRILPQQRRDAMFAIYAFCREVDDIADGDGPAEAKLARLEEWRAEIYRLYDGSATTLTGRALVGPVRSFELRREDFLAIVDGMEMDARGATVAPSMADLETYCDHVAGAVGLLSIRAFGAPGQRAQDFAIALGAALQLTNILRDLREDAELNRLYLPRELLESHGIETRDPHAVLAHPALAAVCRDLAAVARRKFEEADEALADCPAKAMRPAIVMMMHYKRILDRLVKRGWKDFDDSVSISKPEKIWIAVRYGLL